MKFESRSPARGRTAVWRASCFDQGNIRKASQEGTKTYAKGKGINYQNAYDILITICAKRPLEVTGYDAE